MAEAGRQMKVHPKTVGEWAKGSNSEMEQLNGVFKEWGVWEMYFDPEEIKQEKGFRSKPKPPSLRHIQDYKKK